MHKPNFYVDRSDITLIYINTRTNYENQLNESEYVTYCVHLNHGVIISSHNYCVTHYSLKTHFTNQWDT